eukprot:6952339-Prymnesium_polylepis.1
MRAEKVRFRPTLAIGLARSLSERDFCRALTSATSRGSSSLSCCPPTTSGERSSLTCDCPRTLHSRVRPPPAGKRIRLVTECDVDQE